MVMDIFGEGLKMDFGRHVQKMVRIGRMINEQRPRSLRIMLKSGEDRREILARAKSLKDSEKFKKRVGKNAKNTSSFCNISEVYVPN
jgi:hypothetical protein